MKTFECTIELGCTNPVREAETVEEFVDNLVDEYNGICGEFFYNHIINDPEHRGGGLMPNHCYQSVYLAGDPKEIDRLYEAVKEQKFLNAVIPEPSTMFHGALGEDERKMCEAQGRPNWYDWRNENWLTKWDICEPEIIEEPQDSNHYPVPVKYFYVPMLDGMGTTHSSLEEASRDGL
jgi:hypothetical protein